MIIVMRSGVSETQAEKVRGAITSFGLRLQENCGTEKLVLAVLGDVSSARTALASRLWACDGVEEIIPISKPYKLASCDFHPAPSVVCVDGRIKIGGDEIVVIAGPCAVESRDQILRTAIAVHAAGAKILRGGAFKPRTSPDSFQGMEEEGLRLLAEAREFTGLAICTEVMSVEQLALVEAYADILQIGARNCQNFPLLTAVGKSSKPVLLKRGPSVKLDEYLGAAEYILRQGNSNVILCERGVIRFGNETRNTTDINAIPWLKLHTHLPILLDPSHSTGKRDIMGPIALAGIAAGADGLIIEVHPHPDQALSDGEQSLPCADFEALMPKIKAVAEAVGREM